MLGTGGGNTEGIYYQSIAGMKADMSGARSQAAQASHPEHSSSPSANSAEIAESSPHTAPGPQSQHTTDIRRHRLSSQPQNEDSRLTAETASGLPQSEGGAELDQHASSGSSLQNASLCSQQQHLTSNVPASVPNTASSHNSDR